MWTKNNCLNLDLSKCVLLLVTTFVFICCLVFVLYYYTLFGHFLLLSLRSLFFNEREREWINMEGEELVRIEEGGL